MKCFRVAVGGMLFLLAVTAAFGMSVKSDYDKNFNFTRLRTFSFKTDRADNDPLRTNTIEAERIQNALAAQLEANGFSQSPQDPDFIVAFYSRTREKTQVQRQTTELVWRGVVKDTVNGIGQSENQANEGAKDLVKSFLKDAKKVDKKNS